MPRELDAIADALRNGRPVEPVSVRTFLGWFDAHRRGWRVVHSIREKLAELNIDTYPDFESRWIDAPLDFIVSQQENEAETPKVSLEGSVAAEASVTGVLTSEKQTLTWISKDPTYRISKLAAANGGVERVSPDAPIAQAVTLMLARDFSQLPVMTTDREVKGLISWRSIGSRLSLGQSPSYVRNCMEAALEVASDTSIFDAIPSIVRYGYTLVRGEKNLITGIVTASDLSIQFQSLTEPFLLLSEIENLIRNMIGDRFDADQLAEARDPGGSDRKVENVADLSFGEYIRLLEKPERWYRLSVAIDRDLFCKNLDRIREIRNDVMHFDPDGITRTDLSQLRDFAQFLKNLEILRM